MKNFSLNKIASFLDLPSQPVSPLISGYAIDSRAICEGNLFFALPGEKVDGHAFLADVKQKGAVSAVVSKMYQGPHFGLHLLKVPDVSDALRSLATMCLQKHPTRIAAITGSVGKTTTKEFIATLLEKKYCIGKTFASFNSKLTVPLMILNRTGKEEIFILEMGASEPGDLARLVQIAPPEVAVITKIGLAHAANFPKGLEDIAKEKGMIFSHPMTKCAIFDASFAPFAKDLKPLQQILIQVFTPTSMHPKFPFAFPHLWHNFTAAMHVASYFGLTSYEIEAQMQKLVLPSMRSQSWEKNDIFYLSDAYNANPESMRAALENLQLMKVAGKKIAALGSMKELGMFSEKEHAEIGRFAATIVDSLFVIGQEAYPLYEAFCKQGKEGVYCTSQEEMASCLKAVLQKGDALLVKGSRSMQMEKIIEMIG